VAVAVRGGGLHDEDLQGHDVVCREMGAACHDADHPGVFLDVFHGDLLSHDVFLQRDPCHDSFGASPTNSLQILCSRWMSYITFCIWGSTPFWSL
jgi:hypothetical protein